jgi:hypothetical protein
VNWLFFGVLPLAVVFLMSMATAITFSSGGPTFLGFAFIIENAIHPDVFQVSLRSFASSRLCVRKLEVCCLSHA